MPESRSLRYLSQRSATTWRPVNRGALAAGGVETRLAARKAADGDDHGCDARRGGEDAEWRSTSRRRGGRREKEQACSTIGKGCVGRCSLLYSTHGRGGDSDGDGDGDRTGRTDRTGQAGPEPNAAEVNERSRKPQTANRKPSAAKPSSAEIFENRETARCLLFPRKECHFIDRYRYT